MRKIWLLIPRNIRKRIKAAIVPIYKLIAILIPVDKKLITFSAYNGKNYSGSPKALYEYMVDNQLDRKYRIIWFIHEKSLPARIPGNAEQKPYNNIMYYCYMARAKVWISDSRNPDFMIRKRNQKYIQIWHGTPYKTLGLDIENLNMAGGYVGKKKYQDNIRSNSRQWDYMVTQNDFSIPIFQRCFDYHKTFLTTGYPRNDVLFKKNNPEDIAALKKEMGIPLDKKVILYAPTYRDNQFNTELQYSFKTELDYGFMQRELSNEYVLIVKYHYFIAAKADLSDYKGFVYQMDPNEDIASLYLVSDYLITDYSSVMFDYSLLHRPMFFYCYDLENYANELRGCYFNLVEEVPGPISRTTEELIHDIKTYDSEVEPKYREKSEAFYAKYHTYENGTACEQITGLIEELMSR